MVVQRHFDGKRDNNACVPYRMLFRSNNQRGVFAPMSAVLLMLILALCSMALGLSQLYNRKVELQGIANAVALAAARELNGTDDGIALALQRAATTAGRFHYNYLEPVVWSDNAISFSNSPEGGWVASGSEGAQNLFYVRVDTAMLGSSAGMVAPVFAQFLTTVTDVMISASAVAGRVGVKVLPLALCALDNAPAANRASELVEYGFRRGIPYDLMHLNPASSSNGIPEHFVIDPIVAPGVAVTEHNTSVAVVGPFVCTGKMWMPRVTGGNIQVSRPFPIDSLYKQLNSRFDQYPNQLCSPNGAPPDFNVRSFSGNWMSPGQDNSYTEKWKGDGKLRTVADPLTLPAGTTPKMWGALWSYAKAAKYASYQAGRSEPQFPRPGYSTFDTADFPTLYQAGVKATGGYPNAAAGGTPYKALVTNAPNNRRLAEENRRVLNVPLLSCPVSSGTNVNAEVLAVGKFFMTEPATETRIVAEFAGIAPEQTLIDQVELFK